jgi:molybdopterin converting factor small subunit
MSRLHDAPHPVAPSIAVSVVLSAALRRRRPGRDHGPERHVLPAGATLPDLLTVLGLDAALDVTAAIDGELADRTTPLRDGAEVVLLVPMEGGAEAEGEATMRKAVKGSCSKPQSKPPEAPRRSSRA